MKATRYYPAVIIALLAVSTAMFFYFTARLADVQQISERSEETDSGRIYKWHLVTSWPKNYPGLGTAPEKLARWVKKMSSGRLLITVHGSNELVPALGVFDAVSQGNVQLGHSAAYYWKGKSPAAPLFTSIPFGMTAQEMNAWLYYGGGMELWKELYEPFNIIPLAAGNSGTQMAGWFNREINSLSDIKGLKMRIPGLGGEVLNRAGGTAVTIPGGELYTSLQTGVIDATEWVGPYNDLSFGLHEIAEYYYYPGWHEPGPTLELSVNRKAFESLPEDLQQILTVAARAINQDMLDEYNARNNTALQALINEHNVKLKRLPDDVIQELKKISEEIIQELTQNDEFARRAYSSYRKFQKSVSAYNKISERAYLEARDR